jgi:hypothetical protein
VIPKSRSAPKIRNFASEFSEVSVPRSRFVADPLLWKSVEMWIALQNCSTRTWGPVAKMAVTTG